MSGLHVPTVLFILLLFQQTAIITLPACLAAENSNFDNIGKECPNYYQSPQWNEAKIEEKNKEFNNLIHRSIPLCLNTGLHEDAWEKYNKELTKFKNVFREINKAQKDKDITIRWNEPDFDMSCQYTNAEWLQLYDKLNPCERGTKHYDPILCSNCNWKFRYSVASHNNLASKITKIFHEAILVPDKSQGTFYQWIHAVVYLKEDVKGLLVQGFSAPLGVPFGTFVLDKEIPMNCECYYSTSVNLKLEGTVIPCMAAPKSASIHPSFVIFTDIKRVYPSQTSAIHYHFKFTNVNCEKVTAIQFLYIAVLDFESGAFKSYWSPVYELTGRSPNAQPYSYYENFKDYLTFNEDHAVNNYGAHSHYSHSILNSFCHIGDEKCKFTDNPTRFQKLNDDRVKDWVKIRLRRTVVSEEYDLCVSRKTKVDLEGCPPGPFINCEYNPAQHNWTSCSRYSHFHTNYTGENALDYYDAIVKKCKTDNVTKSDNKTSEKDEELNYSSLIKKTSFKRFINVARIIKSYHGAIMIFAWLVFSSFGNFVARFYKNTTKPYTASSGTYRMPWWMWLHLILANLVVGLNLIGATMLLTLDCKDPNIPPGVLKVAKTGICHESADLLLHKIIGGVVLVISYVVLVLGWIRTSENKWVIWIHSLCGHSLTLLAGIATLFTRACPEIKLAAGVLIVWTIIASISCHFLQAMETKRLIKEGEIDPDDGPYVASIERKCNWIRIMIFFLVAGVYALIFYFLVVTSYLNSLTTHKCLNSRIIFNNTAEC